MLNRYNIAQVQGLLLQAERLEIRLPESRLKEFRLIFRRLRFERLLAEMTKDGSRGFRLEVSGPLSLFGAAQGYGLRIARFFPWILAVPDWELAADLKTRKGSLQLQLKAASCDLRFPFRGGIGHVPEEFRLFEQSFRGLSSPWEVQGGGHFFNAGEENYCFPDFTFVSGRQKRHMELFHRWHRGQLLKRLNIIIKYPNLPLLLGISRLLKKDDEIIKTVEKAESLGAKVFWFTDFPLAKAVLSRLS